MQLFHRWPRLAISLFTTVGVMAHTLQSSAFTEKQHARVWVRWPDFDFGKMPAESNLEIVEGVSRKPRRPEWPHFRVIARDEFHDGPTFGKLSKSIANFVHSETPISEYQ